MKTWVRKTLSVGVLAAGALLFTPAVAQADINQMTSSNLGALNGTQVAAPINVPVNVGGIGLGILGEGNGSASFGGSGAAESGEVTQASTDNTGLLNGTQAYVPVHVPINIGGIGVGVLGEGNGSASFGGETESHRVENGEATQVSSDNLGVLNGTQAYVPVHLPINIGGIGAGVLGEGNGSAAFGGAGATESGAATQASTDNMGALNGTQVAAPINAPVCVGGVGVGILGTGNGSASCGAQGGGSAEDTTQVTSGNTGALNGTQVAAPINAPVCVGGVGVGILGEGNGSISCGGDATGGGTGGEDPDYSGGSSRQAREVAPVAGLTRGLDTNGLNIAGLDLLGALG